MYAEPTSHIISPKSGTLSNHKSRYEKKLSDLEGLYGDAQAFAELCKNDSGRIVYAVEDVRPAQDVGDLIFGVTYMEPGIIGDEFFMTRGHIHAKANRPETYYGESGEGLMLLESPEGETRILKISARIMVYVPPYWIHRSVNTGVTPLVMSFCYPSDSGQDYEIIAKSGGMRKRIVRDGTSWKAIDNTNWSPRSAETIENLKMNEGI